MYQSLQESSLLAAVERRVSPLSYDTWFRPVRAKIESSRVILCVPNPTFRDWIAGHYSEILRDSLGEADLANLTVTYLVDDDPAARATAVPPREAAVPTGLAADAGSPPAAADAAGHATAQVSARASETPLNPRYTFDSFVVGSSNQFAHAAAKAVADAPGQTYNPLYIYGGVGLGKTHLMHAIGQHVKARSPHLRVTYISSEQFMNELINAIRYDGNSAFRERYRSVDVLLMDDVQFIAGKDRTQEEFFHTFNALHDTQKQIVITSDCAPIDISDLEDRLHSRFQWGLIADITPPDLETKVAILKRKAENDDIELPDAVALFIATHLGENVRELEGSLVRLIAHAGLDECPMDVDLAERVLRNVIIRRGDSGTVTIEAVQRAVCAEFGLSVGELIAKTNARAVAFPRQIAMYLAKALTGASLPEIGREFGGKHHTTVLHSVSKIADLAERDDSVRRQLEALIVAVKGGTDG